MERIVLYGLGKQFQKNVINNNYLCDKLKKYHKINVEKGLFLTILSILCGRLKY